MNFFLSSMNIVRDRSKVASRLTLRKRKKMLKACLHLLTRDIRQAGEKRGSILRPPPLSGIPKEIALRRTRMLIVAGEMLHQNPEIVERQRPREKIEEIIGKGLRPAQNTLDAVMGL